MKTKPLLPAKEPTHGWTFDYDQIQQVEVLAQNVEQVGMEQVEAVMMGMVDAGFAWAQKPEGGDHE